MNANESNGPTPNPALTPSQKRALLAAFQQDWENARHIKNERISFTNIYGIVAAGVLSLLHSVQGQRVLELSILSFLVVFSLIGLLSTLRLKAELNECLENIGKIAEQLGLVDYMAMGETKREFLRYPKFRWLFPAFYSVTTAGFLFLLLRRIFGGDF